MSTNERNEMADRFEGIFGDVLRESPAPAAPVGFVPPAPRAQAAPTPAPAPVAPPRASLRTVELDTREGLRAEWLAVAREHHALRNDPTRAADAARLRLQLDNIERRGRALAAAATTTPEAAPAPAAAPVPPPAPAAPETLEGLRARYRELTVAMGRASTDETISALRAERAEVERRTRAMAQAQGETTARSVGYAPVQRQAVAPAPVVPLAADLPAVDATTPVRARHAEGAIVAVADADASTGAIVYWHLSGDVSLSALRAAWEAEGLATNLLPAVPGADIALTRAAHELTERHTLVRKHPAGGYAVVRETRTGASLDYTVLVRVHLAKGTYGDKRLTVTPEGAVDEEAKRLTERLVAEHARYMSSLGSTDVGMWLVRLTCGAFGGVALRSTGGIYFVPRANVERLHAVKRALARCAASHVVHEIPAMRSTDTVNAILDAVARETNDEIAAVKEAVAKPNGLGQAAISTRIATIRAMDKKVASYEGLLGTLVTPIRAKLSRLITALLGVKPGRGALLEID